MTTDRIGKLLTFGAAALFLTMSSSRIEAAQVLYRETYGTATTGGQEAPQLYDWAVHVGATAINESAQTGTAPASVNRTANGSKPGTAGEVIGNVNAGPVIGATPAAYGQGIPFATTANANVLFWSPEYPARSATAGINPAAYPGGLEFSWFQGNQNTTTNWKVAIHQGGQWYVSQQQFFNNTGVGSASNFALGDNDGNGGTSHGAELKKFLYTSAASAWNVLNFDGTFTLGATPGTGTGASGTVLSVGAQPGSNLTGVIDAFGLFSDIPGANNRRFDSYTIAAIPEPASVALALFSAVGLAMAARRR